MVTLFQVLVDAGKIDEAKEEFQRALQSQEKLISDYPESLKYREQLGSMLFNFAHKLAAVGRYAANMLHDVREVAVGVAPQVQSRRPPAHVSVPGAARAARIASASGTSSGRVTLRFDPPSSTIVTLTSGAWRSTSAESSVPSGPML